MLFDQRGCGQSTPSGHLPGNDTPSLVQDIEALRLELNVDKWVLFGGSWGTALALAYAQQHPNSTAGLILRGLTPMRRQDIDWLFRGGGANMIYPGAWERFLEPLTAPERLDPVAGYYSRLTSGDAAVRDAAAAAWGAFEAAAAGGGRFQAVQSWNGKEWGRQAVYSDQSEQPLAAVQRSRQPSAPAAAASVERTGSQQSTGLSSRTVQALLTCHYCQHDAFLTPDQLLLDAPAIASLPIVGVHGRLVRVVQRNLAHLAMPSAICSHLCRHRLANNVCVAHHAAGPRLPCGNCLRFAQGAAFHGAPNSARRGSLHVRGTHNS